MVISLSSFVFRLSSFVFRLSSFVFRLSSFVFRHSSLVNCKLVNNFLICEICGSSFVLPYFVHVRFWLVQVRIVLI
uniref:Uncharacterized protein n=1 Tax=Kuenenia stuttgartiensis TaxID=174633 RepID=Q1Q6Q6_KUEST|nr:unknown protein [Candidatus Kuenenia stuttgartiensis]